MNCDRCGGDNPDHITFCRHCGNRLARGGSIAAPASRRPEDQAGTAQRSPHTSAPKQQACPRCGASNSPSLRYCATCGTTLQESKNPAPQAAPAQHAAPAPNVRTAASPVRHTEPAPVAGYGGPQAPGKECWRCQTPIPEEAAFCQACGADQRSGPGSEDPTGALAPAARLIVIAQDGTAGHSTPIVNGQLDIGREEGDIVLHQDPYVCPTHAKIQWKGDQFVVRDLGSVNGVYARLTGEESLQHGDMVLTGLQVIRFEAVSGEEQSQGQAIQRGTRIFGSPSTPRYARLVQRTVEGISRDIIYLRKNRTVVGRESGDLVFTDDPFMSRQHAAFIRNDDGSFYLSDLNSSNGTFMAIRNTRALRDGDHVRIGQHLFQLRIDG